LLDRRYDNLNSTVLIANQDKAAFAASVGDSIVSRIHETGESIECNWPSFRRPGMYRENPGGRRVPRGEIGHPRDPSATRMSIPPTVAPER
jgi:hypothetical protein